MTTPSSSATGHELPRYLRYWGKAQPDQIAMHPWHPLAYHSLDVASTARALLEVRPRFRATGARLLGLSEADVLSFVPAFIALHDVGKVAAAFQSKADVDGAIEVEGADDRRAHGHHTEAGLFLWRNLLAETCVARLCGGDPLTLDPLAEAVFAHHGRPTRVDRLDGAIQSYFSSREREDVRALAVALIVAMSSSPVKALASRKQLLLASWWLAGLTNLADWVGSNTEWFPYRAPGQPLDAYARIAASAADSAVRLAGVAAAPPAPLMSFGALTATDGRSLAPTPAQEWAITVPLPPQGPVLAIIEDVTGSGKTEAAQMLVHRLLAADRACGAYWAMPTQATANAMYDRQGPVVHRLFDTTSVRPSLVLAHGQSRLNPGFRATIIASTGPVAAEVADDDEPSSVACAAWVGHDSRRALLADLGAGTVDQALLAALPSRFNALRLAGLANKVVILDEVHAYDAYVMRELEELLRFLAVLDASVILLSATLPVARQNALVQAWSTSHQQLATRVAPSDGSGNAMAPYPLATIAGIGGYVASTQVAAAEGSVRSLPIRWSHSDDDVLTYLASRLQRGAAAAWIRNTVTDCMAAAEAARARGLTPIVFHARFAQCDRQTIEGRVLSRVGKKDKGERAGTLVIATQVIEQSLDLDFDVMVTDLAPVDLVLQRAGRLWRHASRERPPGVEQVLVILQPANREGDPAGWLDALRGGAYVYLPRLLWKSAALLESVRTIEVPSDLRRMIETVYADAVGAAVPSAIEARVLRSDGAALAGGAVAAANVLSPAGGYSGANVAYSRESRTPTRLGDATTTLRLARITDDGKVRPWCHDAERSESDRWRLSEVQVRASAVPSNAQSASLPPAQSDRVRAMWGAFDGTSVLVPLQPDPDAGYSSGLVSSDSSGRRLALTVRYHPESGLKVIRSP